MNTNVFETGDTPTLIELIASLMHNEDEVPDNEIWLQHAQSFLEAFMPAMVWKRDNANLKLDAKSLWNEMDFENVIDLANALKLPSEIRESA